MILPSLRVVLTAPQWLVVTMLAAVIAACAFRIGLDLYLANVKVEDYERVVDDADKGARGVERHDGEIEEIRVYLAARDDSDTDEIPAVRTDTDIAPKIDVVGGAKISVEKLRPVPHRREGVA